MYGVWCNKFVCSQPYIVAVVKMPAIQVNFLKVEVRLEKLKY